jgi:hypothetical protein
MSFGQGTKSPLTFFLHRLGRMVRQNCSGLSINLQSIPEASGQRRHLLVFVYCFLGTHGLVVPPRHVNLLPVRTGSSRRAEGKAKRIIMS